MSRSTTKRLSRYGDALAYAAAIVVSVVAVVLDYDLAHAHLRAPLSYLVGGDSTYFAGAHFKGMVDNAWYLDNAYLGAPDGLDLRDFPAPDLVFFVVLKIATLFTKDWVLLMDLFMIASFPVTAVAALYVVRRFGVGRVAALSAALLYAFIPFHHHRLFGHPHLALGYWVVPFGALLALAVLRGEALSLALLGWAVLVGLTGHVYFTYFAIVILAAAGIAAALRAWSPVPLARAGALLGVVMTAFLAQSAPFVWHVVRHGSIPIARRNPADAEIFALKITQLVLPQTHHRFEALRSAKQAYDVTAPLVNENMSAYLGMIGAAGFFVLVVVLLAQARRRALLSDLAVLNMSALLLGTMGGVGSLIAFAGFPEIRSYNRISVCIGFYSLFAVAVLLDRLPRRWWVAPGVAALTAFGLYETSFAGQPDYEGQKKRWETDRAFVAEIEAALPEGAMVFQLPHMSFPENGKIEQLPDYGPMVPYLHSRRLRWSYGAMRGRRVDDQNEALAELPVEAMIDAVARRGFSAVYVSRAGFADRGAALEADLERLLGPPVVVAKNGIASVFSLARKNTGETAPPPVYLGFYSGFFPVDKRPESFRATCGKRGRILLENAASVTRRVTFEAKARTANGPGTLKLRSKLFDADVPIHDHGQVLVSRTFDLPPGEHWIVAEGDAAPSKEVFGGRRIVFVLDEPRLREE